MCPRAEALLGMVAPGAGLEMVAHALLEMVAHALLGMVAPGAPGARLRGVTFFQSKNR